MEHCGISINPLYIHRADFSQHLSGPVAHLCPFRGECCVTASESQLIFIQALWYFLGSAIILGLLLGLLLHYSLRAFVVVFRLDRKPPAKPPAPKGHDAVSYRKAREAKKKHLEEQRSLATQARLIASQPLIQEVVREARKTPLSTAPATPLSPLSPNIAGPSRPGLLQETILEHSDEDDDDSVF